MTDPAELREFAARIEDQHRAWEKVLRCYLPEVQEAERKLKLESRRRPKANVRFLDQAVGESVQGNLAVFPCVEGSVAEVTHAPILYNLPEAPARFFGPKKLKLEVTAKLAEKGLIVLHETGGMGKTTFAKQVAHDALKKQILPGGAVWINCEPNPKFEDCQRTMTEVLLGSRMENVSVEGRAKALSHYFARHHTLLVFDNFETVLEEPEFNAFLQNHKGEACVLVTAQKIHDGLKPFKLDWEELAPEDAKQLFLYEAGRTKLSAEDLVIVASLCDSVGHHPLAIVLLARQAAKTTLPDLATELRKNFDALSTDDGFLDARHRSMTACFLTSFERLNAEDQACGMPGLSCHTLFQLSVVPHGLGKSLVADYLDKKDWLPSLNRCLNAALLRIEKDRYDFHPLLRSFLFKKMGNRKIEWAGGFVDFFCARLEASSKESLRQQSAALRDEAANYRAAVRHAADAKQFEHFLVIQEFDPDAWYTDPVYQQAEWLQENQWLRAALAKARREHDTQLEERILVEELSRAGALRPDIVVGGLSRRNQHRAEILKQLSRVNPNRASGLRFDAEAEAACERRNWKRVEHYLRKTIHAWETAGDRFRGELQASLVNLVDALCEQDKGQEAAAIASKLWRMLEDGCFCYISMPEDHHEWAESITPEDLWARDLVDSHRNVTIVEGIGLRLHRVKQWREAERWLEKALLLARSDRMFRVFDISERYLFHLAENHVKLGKVEQGESIYLEIVKSPSTAFCESPWAASACFGLAKLAAGRGEIERAIECGEFAIELGTAFIKYCDDMGHGTDFDMTEMHTLVANWKSGKR